MTNPQDGQGLTVSQDHAPSIGSVTSGLDGYSALTQGWLKSGEYLPEFMRDFHEQKSLFKALQEVVERRNEQPNSYTENLTWIAAHVYTVDVFLWVMARHGYTLQRSRKRVPFSNIADFIGAAMERWRSKSASILGLAFANAGQSSAKQVAGESSRDSNND